MEFKEKIKKLNERKLSIEEMINFLLYGVIFILPFMVDPYGGDTYYFPKAIFLWIISGVILILFISNKDYKINFSCKTMIIFIGICILSTIASMDIKKSIIGGILDYNGIITYICYGIIFIAASKYMKIEKKYIEIFLFLGAIMSVYGIFQFYGYDSLPRDVYHINLKECYGTIGHRNFFSTYLLILSSISISSFIFWRSKMCYIYSLLYFAALIGTKTRGGWLTLGVICLIGLLFIIKDKKRVSRAIIIVISFISIFFIMDYFKGGEIKDRFETIKEDVTEITSASGSGRVAIYEATAIIIKNHPILGVGPSCLWEGFVKELPEKSQFWWQNGGVIVDSAHNEILHYATTTGIPSAIIYIVLIIGVLIKVFENIKEDKFKVMFLVILGYIIQANFNISIISVAPLFWITLGIGSNPEIIKRLKIEEA